MKVWLDLDYLKVMGLANDYSREDIDETLKNHSQDMGMDTELCILLVFVYLGIRPRMSCIRHYKRHYERHFGI